MLSAPQVGSKDAILTLLQDIAVGYYESFDATATDEADESDEPGANGGDADPLDEDETDDVEDWDEDDERGPAREPQSRFISEGIPAYETLLDHDEPAVRVAATNLLAACDSEEFDPRPVLDAAYEREQHPAVRACLLLALGWLRHGRDERIAFYSTALHAPTISDAERIAAALKLGEEAGEAIPNEAIDLLVKTLAYPSRRLEADYRMATGAWLDRSIGFILRELPPVRMGRTVVVLTARLPYIGFDRQCVAVSILLRALFAASDGALLPATSLTTEQRAALDAIYAAAPFWREVNTYLTSFAEFGLPDTRPALGDYLGLPSSEDAPGTRRL